MINLGGAHLTLAVAYRDYHMAWKAFLVVHHLDVVEQLAKATTISWKVASKGVLYANLEQLSPHIEQVHIGTVNDRYIASAVLHEPYEGMRIIKVLERRKGSTDPLGLDSIDFLVKDVDKLFTLFKAAGAHVERDHNDMHSWVSLRFGVNLEFEAKFTDHLVLKVARDELLATEKALLTEYHT